MNLEQAIEHLAACEELCGMDTLTEQFEAIRKVLYEQLGRAVAHVE